MAWLIRCCADRFLEVCGYEFNQGNGTLERTEDHLEATVRDIREHLSIDTKLRHVEELVSACIHFKAAVQSQCRATRAASVSRLSFGATVLEAVLKHHVKTKAKPIPGLEGLSLADVDPECSLFMAPKLNELAAMKNHKTLQQTMDALLSELRSKKGMGYPNGLSKYFPIWEIYNRDYPELVAKYAAIDPDTYEDTDLQNLFTQLEVSSGNIG